MSAGYMDMQSGAFMAILIWHRANKMMRSRVNVDAPAQGDFITRAQGFAGVENIRGLTTFLLGFDAHVGGKAFDEFGDEDIIRLVNQVDRDVVSGKIMMASSGRGNPNMRWGDTALPPWLIWNLDDDKGPFCVWRYISTKFVKAVRKATQTRWFRGQGGRSQAQTRRRS